MKITDLKMIHIRPRWMFLKIETDEGICGWGEPVVEGRARTVETAVNEFRPMLIGADPLKIEHLWQGMYRRTFYRGGPILCSAISGIEMALWDIKGKYYNMPVFEMLGGAYRDKVRMYGHLKPTGHPGDFPIPDMLKITDKRLADGFTVMKYSIIPPIRPIDNMEMVDKVVERFAAVRERVGKKVDIAIDFHGRVSPAMSIRLLKALEPYYPLFVEEPVLPENVDEMVRVSRSTTIPIAAGERLFTKFGFRELIEKQAVSVVQPDLCHRGYGRDLLYADRAAQSPRPHLPRRLHAARRLRAEPARAGAPRYARPCRSRCRHSQDPVQDRGRLYPHPRRSRSRHRGRREQA